MNPTPTNASTPSAPATFDYAPPITTSAEEEGRFHNYVGHAIPWFVRVVWLLFWCLAAWYVIVLLLPALEVELLSPP